MDTALTWAVDTARRTSQLSYEFLTRRRKGAFLMVDRLDITRLGARAEHRRAFA